MIFFNVKEARDYLLAHGAVYTLRVARRVGTDTAVSGNLFQHETLGRVKIEWVAHVNSALALIPYVEESGFCNCTNHSACHTEQRFVALMASTSRWFSIAFDYAMRKHKTTNVHLYRVSLLKP